MDGFRSCRFATEPRGGGSGHLGELFGRIRRRPEGEKQSHVILPVRNRLFKAQTLISAICFDSRCNSNQVIRGRYSHGGIGFGSGSRNATLDLAHIHFSTPTSRCSQGEAIPAWRTKNLLRQRPTTTLFVRYSGDELKQSLDAIHVMSLLLLFWR